MFDNNLDIPLIIPSIPLQLINYKPVVSEIC